MEFPKTYVDSLGLRVEALRKDVAFLKQDILVGGKVMTTGTTVIVFLTKDRKSGIMVSDGRVSLGPISMKDDFKKIFDCRVGFVGCAGALTVIQKAMPVFRAGLDEFCDSRSYPVTSSGAAGYLKNLYFAIGDSGGKNGDDSIMNMIAFFWDSEDKTCHLYQFAFLSKMGFDYAAAIGSGGTLAMLDVDLYNSQPANSKEEVKERLRSLVSKISKKDTATNTHLFFGTIDNGEFSQEEEVL